MRRLLAVLSLVCAVAYLGLVVLLGSLPVQRWVLAELQRALSTYGVDYEMESVEFSTLSARAYLNRVRVTTRQHMAPVQLERPLVIDKIKIGFQPLALIFGKIQISDLVFFHPKIEVRDLESLVEQVQQLRKKLIGSKQRAHPQFSLVVSRVGIVDALLDVSQARDRVRVRTPTLSVFVDGLNGAQISVTVDTKKVEIIRSKTRHLVQALGLDVDFTEKSLRVNKASIQSDWLTLNAKGVSSLPFDFKSLPAVANISFEAEAKLEELGRIPELRLPKLIGTIGSSGVVQKKGQDISASGSTHYSDLSYLGYSIGSATFDYSIRDSSLHIFDLSAQYAGGKWRSADLKVGLSGSFPVHGRLEFSEILLDSLLDAVRLENSPVRMTATGTIDVKGTLGHDFRIDGHLTSQARDLIVLEQNSLGVKRDNTVVRIAEGGLDGVLSFFLDRMDFDTTVKALGGQAAIKGTIGFDDGAPTVLSVRAEEVSLESLGPIGQLDLRGNGSVACELTVSKNDVRIASTFDITAAMVEKIYLGAVTGEAYYQNRLLNFGRLEIASIDPVKGTGLVDFSKDDVEYRFRAEAKRLRIDQGFEAIKGLDLSFQPPTGGESSLVLQIQGGGKSDSIEVTASGVAKNTDWYSEPWVSASYSVKYANQQTELKRLLLMKRDGAVEITGQFDRERSALSVRAHDVEVESLARFKDSGVTGAISGDVVIGGRHAALFDTGQGQLKLTRTKFRGVPLADSQLRLTTKEGRMLAEAELVGRKFRGRWTRAMDEGGHLEVRADSFDLAPVLTLITGRELPLLAGVKISGSADVAGLFSEPGSWRGGATVQSAEIALSDTNLKNTQPVTVAFTSKGISITPMSLEGTDTHIRAELKYSLRDGFSVHADGQIDLEYVYAFIPGIDYGTGKVSFGVGLEGPSDRFEMLGDIKLDKGVVRLAGFSDEMRATQARLSLSHDRINVDYFQSQIGGGMLGASGWLRLDRFRAFAPDLKLHMSSVRLKTRDFLENKFSGDFTITGDAMPYKLAGQCVLAESILTRFERAQGLTSAGQTPTFSFDVKCHADDKLFVRTELLDAEFRGELNLVGTEQEIGLLGGVEMIRGKVLFRENTFTMTSGSVRFESDKEILPRFNVTARAFVREQVTSPAQEYEITLQSSGVPSDYRLQLSSSPALSEAEIISLLMLGVTTRGQEGNYGDLGTTIAGQIPLQSKLQNELGVDIKIRTQGTPQNSLQRPAPSASTGSYATQPSPSVQLRKSLSDKTAVSYSNALDTSAISEFRIEQILNENLTVNASVERNQSKDPSETSQSYGLDVRYRFEFE